MQNTDGLAIARSDELIELVTEIFGPWMNFAEAPAPSSQSMYVCMYMYMLHYSVVPISLKCMYVCIFVLISMNSVVSAATIVL